MGAIFPGSNNALPGVYVETVTQSKGVSVTGGTRIAALIGEGNRVERIVASALGGGSDGLDSTYSSTNGADGRHFQLEGIALIENRTTLYKNGIPLVGLEQEFSSASGSFSSRYDYRLNVVNGRIELQSASLIDQGGAFYAASSTNIGNGTITGLTLDDVNAPQEVWTIRCSTIRRDGAGDPIDGYAKFTATGSVSGNLLDGYGNVVTWQSNGVSQTNGILTFTINEGSTNFREGDRFTIRVKSGALSRGDSLTAEYIATADLNDPEFFDDIELLTQKHGQPSTTNRLSLGAQLAFANSPPGVYAVQAAPAVPRRVSYVLEESASGDDTADDLSFALPLGVIPDVDSNIHFFVTDPTTEEESQLIPNKVDFYDPTITSSPNTFHFGVGYDYSYTVILEDSVQKSGDDGVITVVTGTTATLSSETVLFTIDDESGTRSVKILEPAANAGTYSVVSVDEGVVTIYDAGGFANESAVEFEVIDSADTSAKILFTDDLAFSSGQSIRATVVDTRDADFFDAGWTAAYEALEAVECDIVVPLPSQTISTIFQQGNVHCQTMSQIKMKKERVLFIGAINGLTPDNVIGNESAAVEDIGVLEGIQGDDVSEILAGDTEDLTNYSVPDAFGTTYRVVYFYPDEIVVQIGADRTAVDGFFIAAAAAGYLSGVNNVAIPLTNKVLAGFSILRDKLFRPLVLENLAVAGICVLQPAIGGGKVVWGKTTTQSGFAEEEEISIVFIRDKMAKSLRQVFDGFIGTVEDPGLQGTLLNMVHKTMQAFISMGLITTFQDVKVARNVTEPRQWDISVKAQPRYSVNWIYIKDEIGLL